MKSYQKILSVVLSLLLLLTFVLPNFAEAQSIEQLVQSGTESVQGSDENPVDSEYEEYEDDFNYEEDTYEDYSDVSEDSYYDNLADAPVYEDEDLLEDGATQEEIIEDENVPDSEFEENVVTPTESATEPETDDVGEDESYHAQWAWLIPPAVAVVSRVGGKLLVKQTLKSTTKKIAVRNGKLVGKKHPKTGVKFNSKGFPIFASKYNYNLPMSLIKSSNGTQFKNANASLKKAINTWEHAKKFNKYQIQDIKNGKTPRGYIWHHHENTGRLQLVNRTIHEKTGHTGGKSIWGSL
ncbi:HNH endonuclease [Bacillus spizizenii]|nr:HNH endonuclease [Bacillus spizizenii]